jgi:hypothetical protein
MNKKIAGEFAIGIILLIVIVVGGIFWLYGERQAREDQQLSQSMSALKQNVSGKISANQAGTKNQESNSCVPHYYQGKINVSGWVESSDQNSKNGIVVELKSGEEKKLPVKDYESLTNFTVKLVDPTDDVKNKLQLATKEKPAVFTIQGYAEICSQPPLVSLQQATVAFKKS